MQQDWYTSHDVTWRDFSVGGGGKGSLQSRVGITLPSSLQGAMPGQGFAGRTAWVCLPMAGVCLILGASVRVT